MKKQNKKLIFTTLFEIFLVVSMAVTFSYIIDQSNGDSIAIHKRITLISLAGLVLKIAGRILFNGKSFVSALDASDLQQGVNTCVRSTAGKICMEYPASECAQNCDGVCLPATRENTAECKLGTCYDPAEGTCAISAPKYSCEAGGDTWIDDPNGNALQCKKGCCVLGDEAQFITSQQCIVTGQRIGLTGEFKPEVNTEIACLALSKTQEEGACVYEFEFERTCRFTTKALCLQQKGEFRAGLLCSNPELNTTCQKQKVTGCVEGKDEIYWFDSCGNRENIYEGSTATQKLNSFFEGKVKSKTESCSLGSAGNPFANQGTCGNCDYLLGSTCGLKNSAEKLIDPKQNVVCRDLRCDTNDDGKKDREHGESWCVYQGAIGLDSGSGKSKDGTPLQRAVDTPGSRHYRQVCIDGEVRTEPCEEYRNGICIEAKTPVSPGKTFSTAACRLNRWQQCLSYNTELQSKNNPSGTTPEQRDDKCELNPDCFVKEVNIDKNFKFNICAPKYPPGFDLNSNPDASEIACSFANQKCTVYYVKKLSGWECVANCNCEKPGFAEQMNDLCISLGDCGTEVNLAGDLTENSKVLRKGAKTGKLTASAGYINKLKTYSKVVPGKVAEPGNITEFFGSLGIPGELGSAIPAEDQTAAFVSSVNTIGGAAGVTSLVFSAVGLTPGIVGLNLFAANPTLVGATNVLAGAAMGVAVVSILLSVTGVGAGLDPAVIYTLLGIGAVAGALILSQGLSTAGSALFTLAGIPGAGWIILIIVIIIIVVLQLVGVGKSKKIVYNFECKPWQAPRGGAKCAQCGADGLPCGKYQCQSLGQTCEFINEGTDSEACVDIAPNDVAQPVLNPLQGVISPGFEYTEVTDNGYRIKGTAENECIGSYQPLIFGLAIDEPAQCRFDIVHTESFDDMEFDFGRALFLINQTMFYQTPSLESLGLPGYDPERRAENTLYVRCEDKSGNKNDREYTINFCVKPGIDLTPPIVTGREPILESVRYNVTEQAVSVYTNEPAECKWSLNDKGYDEMENNFICANELEEQTLLGWKCDSSFPVAQDENKYYVRCEDQPWLIEATDITDAQIIVPIGPTDKDIEQSASSPATNTEGVPVDLTTLTDDVPTTTTINVSNDRKRNSMQESYIFSLKKSRTNLNIDYIKPDNQTLTFAVQPVTVNVEVKTSGGIDGKAKCEYGFMLGSYVTTFSETFGTIHKQTFNQFLAGEKILPIRCTDLSGNTAEKVGRFTIKLDTDAPKVTRAYQDNGNLVIVTNENAECAFTHNSCSFDFSNATLMSGTEKVHSSEFNRLLTHYVKCKDGFGNAPGACNIVVKEGVV